MKLRLPSLPGDHHDRFQILIQRSRSVQRRRLRISGETLRLGQGGRADSSCLEESERETTVEQLHDVETEILSGGSDARSFRAIVGTVYLNPA